MNIFKYFLAVPAGAQTNKPGLVKKMLADFSIIIGNQIFNF